MSDEVKPRGPRRKVAKPRVLLVNNPSPSSSDDERNTYYKHQASLPSTSQSFVPEQPQPANNRVHPPPLTTDLQGHRPFYPSSQSNPSNPALSSPSSTSSHARESTPPPSTPGQSQPSVDTLSEGTLRPENAPFSIHQRTDSLPNHPARSPARDRFKPQSSRANHVQQLSARPATSPTLSTPDSSSPAASSQSRSIPVVNILVTSDSDTMIRVDITGFRDAAFIRERIWSKLRIEDEEQPRHSIYRTEIGQYAISEALTDDQLFELCRDYGDAKGSIKLLVSPSHAQVHESAEPAVTSPISNPIIPPLLPQHGLYAPLRPKPPREKSRRGSLSSATSERLPEANTGYEASVSDDLEHDREPRRTIRPLPQYTGFPPRPKSPPGRPPSPNMLSPDRAQVQSPESARSDRTRRIALPTPPALSHSPQSSRFQDSSQVSSWQSRSASDAVAVADRSVNKSDKPESSNQSRKDAGVKASGQSESRRKETSGLQRSKAHHEHRRDPWHVVPSNVPSSDYKRERPITPHDSRSSPSSSRNHSSPQAYPQLTIPPQPRMDPPAPPVSSSDSRTRKSTGKQVPSGWAKGYNPEASLQTTSPPWTHILGRPSPKSMTDLRSAFKRGAPVPASLQPGRSGKPSPSNLPITRPATSGNVVSNISTGFSSVQSSAGDAISPSHSREQSSFSELGLPKSYDGARGLSQQSPIAMYQTRQANNSQHSASASSGSYLGPPASGNQDPYPRPRSALGNDPSGSPYRPSRHLQSPSGPEFPVETATRSQPLPPPHYYPASVASHVDSTSHSTASNYVSRPPPHAQSHPEASSSPFERSPYHAHIRALPIPQPSAPRSPVAPISSPPESERKTSDQFPIQRTLSSLPVQEDDPAENTIRRDDYSRYLNTFQAQGSGSNTMVPVKDTNVTPRQASLQPSSTVNSVPTMETAVAIPGGNSTTTLPDLSNIGGADSDGDGDGTLWIKPPKVSSSNQPPWQDSIPPPPPLPASSHSGRPTLAPISTDNSPLLGGSTALPGNSHRDYCEYPRATVPNLPTPPNYIPESPPMHKRLQVSGNGKRLDQRTSRFDNNFDSTWAPRPPIEEVVERIHEYFPEHDVDKPVIEAPSGGASPTSADHPTLIPQLGRRSGHKKSIRYVAAEHKRRIDRTSRMEPANVQTQLRKRNTKLWGSRVEEVTSEAAADDLPTMTSESSPGGAKPIFRWVRGELIGKGTYGKVYLALNATTGEMIAVKQVEIPRTDSDINDTRQVSVVEALKLESETLKDLDHPNIVQYLGFEETPTFLSIFLEYVPGGSIASCLRKHGKFDEEVTKSFTGQILSGLEYLHSKGILHRDLKADNILVETSGVCKISDFGISKRTNDIDMAGIHTSMQGTIFWMAPEVINSQKGGYNSKIDIWSVGCVVFEMWSGQRPWSGQEAMAVLLHLYQTRQAPPVPPDVTLSPLADDFRKRCFAMDPDERPSAAELQKHPYLVLQPDWTFNGFK